VLPLPTFSTLRHRGVSVRDWTERLAVGRRVADVGRSTTGTFHDHGAMARVVATAAASY
jgi:hypothetical protein